MSKTYNLFISHSWAYTDAYEKLLILLDKDSNFSYKNYSIPKDDPIHDADNDRELYDAIIDQMKPCSIILIMAGKYSTYSKWIKKEIKIAQTEFTDSKPIIGINPWGNAQVSSVVSDAALEIVSWNSSSIIKAIKEYAL